MVSLSEDHVKKTINIKVIFLEPLKEKGGPGETKKHESIVSRHLQVMRSGVFKEIIGHHHRSKQPRRSKHVMEKSTMVVAS